MSTSQNVLLALALLGAACRREDPAPAASTTDLAPGIAPPSADAEPPAPVRDRAAPPRATTSTAGDEQGLDLARTEFEGIPVQKVESAWPDGSQKRIAFAEKDKRGRLVDHGPDWRWFENREICLQRVWRHGRQSGPYREWYESGMQKATGAFADDERDGPWIAWHETGEPQSEGAWSRGKRIGRYREWFDDGTTKNESHWKDGLQDGPAVSWYRGGQKSAEGGYLGGVRHGEWREWGRDGRESSRGSYEKGFETGLWTRIDETNRRVEEHYAHGLLQGPRTLWSAEGVKIEEGLYTAGKAEGLQRTWWPSGSLLSESEYRGGKQNGRTRYFFEKGGVQIEGEMVDGKREGLWTFYKPDGSVDPQWTGRYRQDVKVPE